MQRVNVSRQQRGDINFREPVEPFPLRSYCTRGNVADGARSAEGGEAMAGFEPLERLRLATKVRIQKALEQIKARGVNNDYCPRCNHFDWNVDLLDIPANSAISRFPITGGTYVQRPVWEQATGALSVLSIVCKNCGYTIFHTLNVLET
jgi:hypothetical protein